MTTTQDWIEELPFTYQEFEDDEKSLEAFINEFHEGISQAVVEAYPPIYQPNRAGRKMTFPKMLREPKGAQRHAIQAAALSMRTNKGTNLVGEMGTGKTYIAIAAARMAGFKRTLIVCPPHLTKKWVREIKLTIPEAEPRIAESITDLEKLRAEANEKPTCTIISREKMRNTYQWKPAVIRSRKRIRNHLGMTQTVEYLRCPGCNEQPQIRKEHYWEPLTLQQIKQKKTKCNYCGAPLWQADNKGFRRISLTAYIKKRLKSYFDLLILDEAHEYKASKSSQGIQAGALAEACGKCLTLTGTFMGGYASTLFHLLYRFSPGIRQEFGYDGLPRWIKRYGFTSQTYERKYSKKRGETRVKKSSREKPGTHPEVLFHLIHNTIFLKLSDVTDGLPDYQEEILQVDAERRPRRVKHPILPGSHPLQVTLLQIRDGNEAVIMAAGNYKKETRSVTEGEEIAPMTRDNAELGSVAVTRIDKNLELIRYPPNPADPPERVRLAPGETYIPDIPTLNLMTQENGCRTLENYLQGKIITDIERNNRQEAARHMHQLLTYPDAGWQEYRYTAENTGELLLQLPALPKDQLYPKELALVKLIQEERAKGRRTLVYISHTNTPDLIQRVKYVLESQGINAATLRAETAGKADRREEWINEQIRQGIDALITNPKLVQTGLDLIPFPTVVWYENDYSIYTIRQASRRSWRIGQTEPVRVIHMCYRNTLQAKALQLIAQKMQYSLIIEGELPEEGLAALSEDRNSIVMTLARQIAEETPTLPDSLEDIFARARQESVENEKYLAAPGWEIEPDQSDHSLEDREAEKRTLWGELAAAAPVKRGKGKNAPANPSLFDWALQRTG